MEPQTILVVDDEPLVRDVISAALQYAGCRVISADSAATALQSLENGVVIDLAVVDLLMPGENGAELGRHLRARGMSCPILYTSGLGDSDVAALLQPGPNESYLSKPFNVRTLLERVGALTNQAATAAA